MCRDFSKKMETSEQTVQSLDALDKGGSHANTGKQTETELQTQRVLGASHDTGPPLWQVVKEAAKVEAHFLVCVKVHFPDPNKSCCFQLLSPQQTGTPGWDISV